MESKTMNNPVRLLLLIIAPFALLLASGISCNRAVEDNSDPVSKSSQALIKVTQVEPSPLNRKTVLSASIEGEHQTELFPRIEGIVSEVYVKIGDRVKKDTLLVLLRAQNVADRVRHREELVKESQAEMKRREAGIKLAEAEIKSREAALKIRTIKKNRMDSLVKRGSLSKQRLDEAVFEVSSAEADLQHAHAEVEAAQADLEVAKAKIEVALADLDAAQTNANYREIRAPFDGLITARHVDPGDFVQPNDPKSTEGLLDIVRYDQVRAVVYIPLEDAAYVGSGDPVLLRHQSHTGNGLIDSIGGNPLTISRAARAFNIGSRMMRAEIDIDNEQLEKDSGKFLVPGDYGKVWVTLESLEGKPMVPRQAIFSSVDGSKYLVSLDDNLMPNKVPIESIVFESEGRVVIEAPGLELGQRIVSSSDEDLIFGEPLDPSQLKKISDLK
jgi:RND family efflux transporter MFP subunit